MPSISILPEPPVTVVDSVAKRRCTETIAKAYLEYLYSPQGQDIAGRHFYRPTDAKVAAKYSSQFVKVDMLNIQDFGGWQTAQNKHFSDDGIFDQIYSAGRR